MKIHHIGYLVKKLEKAQVAFENLGYAVKQDVVLDEYRQAKIMFLEKDGYVIELVSPVSKESVVADLMKKLDQRFSEKYGEGTYLRWVSWSVANQWDINDSHDPGSGIRYGEHEKARYGQINYNPYLP